VGADTGSGQNIITERDAFVAARDIIINPEKEFGTPFLVVDQEFLAREQQKDPAPYVARPPTWADVVHGENADAKFLQRDQFEGLLREISDKLLEPVRGDTDRRLRGLFVTGPPGSGKSTLVRHAAATLVERGEAIVADLGVNQGRFQADDMESYLRGLSGLLTQGRPILLLMDDPFFANSGWDTFLERLARPSHAGIAVLGASPSYLFQTFGRQIPGRQVDLKSFKLDAISDRERLTLASMYGVPEDAANKKREDLLVFAMETATGNSFDEIIERIWSTLNNGLPISPWLPGQPRAGNPEGLRVRAQHAVPEPGMAYLPGDPR